MKKFLQTACNRKNKGKSAGYLSEIQTPLIKKKSHREQFVRGGFGGDEEDRTLDLTDANRTLSQLSYAPISFNHFTRTRTKSQVFFQNYYFRQTIRKKRGRT